MTRDFRRYLLLVAAPSFALTLAGLAFLGWQTRRAAEQADVARAERAVAIADEVRDAVRDAGRDDECRRAALSACLGETPPLESLRRERVERPVAAFEWRPKLGVAWSCRLSPRASERLARQTLWRDWTNRGRRNDRHGWLTLAAEGEADLHVVWGRVDSALYALVYDAPPDRADLSAWLWPIGALFVLLLGGTLALGAWWLWRSAEKARRDDLVKTSFVSNASHELKTPLAAMRIWTDLLASGRLADDAQRRHALEVISSENARMLRLVENLLDFSRLEQTRRKYRLGRVDLGEAAREAAEFLRGELDAAGIVCTVSGSAAALADADAVRQILVNLLGNAVKYAAIGKAVEVDALERDGRAVVRVADRGPGMPPEAMARAFERFWREHDEMTATVGGLGLGLSISRSLARGMGGELSVSAREGGGCVFALELPAANGANGDFAVRSEGGCML